MVAGQGKAKHVSVFLQYNGRKVQGKARHVPR